MRAEGRAETLLRGDQQLQQQEQRQDDDSVVGQEDCLYLNVFVPRAQLTATTGAAVLFFLHGGSFVKGSGSSAVLEARALAASRNSVVVTTNYRLGCFGFLALDELLAESGTTGNYGLLDQRIALQWTQQHINAFGGDPSALLLFGQSAGAVSVQYHLTMAGSAGLFAAAAVQSAPAWDVSPLDTARRYGYTFAALQGCADDAGADLACLRQLPASELSPYGTQFYSWQPVLDGTEVLRDPMVAMASDTWSARVPLLLGTTNDELSYLVYMLYTSPMSATDFRNVVSRVLRYNNTRVEIALSLYPSQSGDNRDQLTQFLSDFLLSCPTRRVADLHSRTLTGDTFLYRFYPEPHCTNTAPQMIGSFHGSDLLYLFDGAPLANCNFSDGDYRLAQSMRQLWTTFAAEGALPPLQWPPFWRCSDAPTYDSLALRPVAAKDELPIETNMLADKCDFWYVYYGWGSPSACTEAASSSSSPAAPSSSSSVIAESSGTPSSSQHPPSSSSSSSLSPAPSSHAPHKETRWGRVLVFVLLALLGLAVAAGLAVALYFVWWNRRATAYATLREEERADNMRL
eukprot:TRINITY_DN1383_c0_g1_i5.p1 TRINITY_DN1383_c0_g1~~TRINITY_DN1383_c0_g1_i5.p1  ORF type:complete len:572 (-),score=116.57 TRINITY_DN1383_c0_g1_i5:38-1753(-)